MDKIDDLSARCNSLNQFFYKQISQDFSDSRQYFWHGWQDLWINVLEPGISKQDFINLNVLDLGCGNARFYDFLETQFTKKGIADLTTKLNYTGIDFTKELLDDSKNKNIKLLEVDVLTQNWLDKLDENFDLIVAFGLMHHIKDGSLCDNFFNQIKAVLKPDGLVVLVTWNFVNNPTLMERKADFNNIEIQEYLTKFSLTKADFTENDYLLDWQRGSNAWRYCHYYTEDEMLNLLAKHGLNLSQKFYGDGKNSVMNTYWVCTIANS